MAKKPILLLLITLFISACSTGAAPQLADELVFYDWVDDMPQSVLDQFEEEFGVHVNYIPYEAVEDAEAELAAGAIYDVAVLENDSFSDLIEDGMLAEIDYTNVPNFKNISANFRDLAYDPGNKHSIPFNWGTTGLLVRTDLVDAVPTKWADLWDPQYQGQIAIREDVPFDFIGLTLKSLGYGLNSEDESELAEVGEKMQALGPHLHLAPSSSEDAVKMLMSGEAAIMVGWVADLWEAGEDVENIVYVLPEEGSMLWGDNFVIPASSTNPYTAEVFLNFLLRPDISASITNENYYATPNDAALEFIDPEILEDPLVFPSPESLLNAEVYLPLPAETDAMYMHTWEQFMASLP